MSYNKSPHFRAWHIVSAVYELAVVSIWWLLSFTCEFLGCSFISWTMRRWIITEVLEFPSVRKKQLSVSPLHTPLLTPLLTPEAWIFRTYSQSRGVGVEGIERDTRELWGSWRDFLSWLWWWLYTCIICQNPLCYESWRIWLYINTSTRQSWL